MILQSFKKENIVRTLVIFGFAVIYSIISFVNHYLFRTNAHDFGILNQSLYDYAHFRVNNNTVLDPNFGNILSDHFEILMIIFSPLYYIFGSYTLLIVQIIAIIIGGQGIYKFIELISNRKLAFAAMIQFFLFFGIYSALSFDYHNNVVGTMAVPWLFYFIHKEKWKQTIIIFTLFLLSKENMALWGFFIFIGLMIKYRKDRKKLMWSAILATVSIIYFIVIVKCVIPSLGKPGATYLHFRYSALGSNFGEALTTIVTKPVYTFKLLFVNQLGFAAGDYVKSELHIAVLLSGGILLFYRPYYLLMLLPIYGQKMFCDVYTYWGLSFHYSVEFLPIITVGAFTIISEINKEKTRRICAYLLIILTAAITFHSMDHTFTYFNREKQRFYQKPHYTRDFDVKETYNALKMIPENAAVCAQDEFVSHLCFREKIYLFPYITDASYIVVNSKANIYPFSKEKDYTQSVAKIDSSSVWVKIYDSNFMKIFKRKI